MVPENIRKPPPRRLKRALLVSHSRGAMLHCIGAHVVFDPKPAQREVTPATAALFGAPMPKVAQ